MFLKLGLFSLVLLLLPRVQSSRSRFVTSRSHVHHHTPGHHHASSSQCSRPFASSSQLHELPKPHIQMVTGSNEKHSQYGNFDIAMVTMPHIHEVPDQLGGMLDTPVFGPNPGGNSESLAASSGQNLLGNMLDTRVSGPNPGGNSESLLVSGPNLGGSPNTVTSMLDTPISGPRPSGNSNALGNMLDTPVSGPNPGGNSQGLFVSGQNSRGNSAKGLANKLDNMLDTPVSGPNPGGKSVTLGDMLDNPVLRPKPGGNSQNLIAVLGPNLGGNSQILAKTTSSGPNPGSSMSEKAEAGTLFNELPRTPVPPSGPSPIHN